jgi:hypothetical protein
MTDIKLNLITKITSFETFETLFFPTKALGYDWSQLSCEI